MGGGVSIYIYRHIHTHRHTYMHTHTPAHTHTHTRTHTHTETHTHTYIYIYICTADTGTPAGGLVGICRAPNGRPTPDSPLETRSPGSLWALNPTFTPKPALERLLYGNHIKESQAQKTRSRLIECRALPMHRRKARRIAKALSLVCSQDFWSLKFNVSPHPKRFRSQHSVYGDARKCGFHFRASMV